ncbi:hypothetical protein MRB53_041768 [Persea americana]|nr:hypothetical protein MRB53_041768 [Persea americana]
MALICRAWYGVIVFLEVCSALAFITGIEHLTDTSECCRRILFDQINNFFPGFYKKDKISSYKTRSVSRWSFMSRCYYRVDDDTVDYLEIGGWSQYMQQCPLLWEAAQIEGGIGYCKLVLGQRGREERASIINAQAGERKTIFEYLYRVPPLPQLTSAENDWALLYEIDVRAFRAENLGR